MILKFINRKSEIKALKQAQKSKKAEFFVIYGRRRIGKTELIKEFSKNTKHFYYLAKKQNIEIEIEEFRNKFSEKFNIYLKENKIEEIFKEILTKINLKEKFVIIIDEFPYWIVKDETITSKFQYIWDELLKNKNIFLILCGSYMSIMEEKVLSKKSPLYGRRTGQLKLEPMRIKYLKNFLPKYKIEELIETYGATGTIPFYLKEMNSSTTFLENINNTFFNKANILNKEAEFILREELREPHTYLNILKSIIDGATKISEIATKSKVDITNIHKYLRILTNLKLIKKIKPINSAPKEKRYIYKVEDNYYRFWLTYIYPYETDIEEDPKSVLKTLGKNYPRYLSPIFEDFCQKIIRKLNIKINKLGMKTGKWWYKDKEIDIIALNENTKEILFVECKYKHKVNPEPLLKELKEKAEWMDWNKEKRKEYYAIFAKSFTKKTKQCYDLKDIEKVLKN